jgi:NADPH:quinone reductase-like Zn-dependent oxidoreductase
VRAARLHGVGDLRVGEEPVPDATAGMSLVKVTAVGICGSDLHWWDEGAIGDAGSTRPSAARPARHAGTDTATCATGSCLPGTATPTA